MRDTYDAYIDLMVFMAYENNLAEKLCFLEINMRKCKGYIETFYAAKDKQLVVKFDLYKAMRYAVSMFNQFFNNHGLVLRMKKYYLHHSRRISTKEFKILHMPKDLDETTIKDTIRALLKAFPFYIRATGETK